MGTACVVRFLFFWVAGSEKQLILTVLCCQRPPVMRRAHDQVIQAIPVEVTSCNRPTKALAHLANASFKIQSTSIEHHLQVLLVLEGEKVNPHGGSHTWISPKTVGAEINCSLEVVSVWCPHYKRHRTRGREESSCSKK